MKILILISLIMSFSSFAISHKEFVKLSRTQREQVLTAYKNFLDEYSKTVEVSSALPENFFQLIEEAHATNFDCLYGGWPSTRVNGSCPLPRTNPAFQRESCPQGEVPCQPLLFGRGVCVGNTTRLQKRSTFASCQSKFNSMNRHLSDVVEYISDPEMSQEADELFRLVDDICRTGAQASTGMCSILKARVATIQSQRQRPAAQPPQDQRSVSAPNARGNNLTVASDAARIEATVRSLNTTTNCLTCDAIREQTTDEPATVPPQIAQPATPAPTTAFPRIWSGFTLESCGGSRGTNDGYDIKTIFDCQSGPRLQAGFKFFQTTGDPNVNLQTRYPNGSAPSRNFEIASINQAFNETYLMIEESGGGPDSHNVKSYMFLLPRTTVPSVRIEGNNLIATLPTGETVTMDKNTRAITAGALTEGPIDLNTDRFQRRPPNINYSGSGISIRLNHRFEHPLTSAATATIQQGSKTCTIPRTAILDDSGKLKTESDASLLAVLNQTCRGGGFHL